MCVCGDGGREVIRLTHFHGEPGTGAIPTPYTVQSVIQSLIQCQIERKPPVKEL